ncbi:MAG: tripartite tricarboxylate transporter substrate binding protein [Betaproteobacteria bacterium]|nr:tripartite tricarboxylate transporter substrate binding protein [Betaproteobacteria bacterium]
MKFKLGDRHIFSVLVAASGLCLGHPALAAEGGWQPEGPVEIVVPTAAGGENDRVARFIQKIFEQKKLVSTPVVVVNKAGGNQVLSTVYVAKKTADAHALLYATGTVQSNEIAGLTDISYRDLTPIAKLRCDNTAVTVAPDSPIKDMPDLIRRLKVDVKSVSFGTVSRGGANNLVLAKALRSGGVDPNGLKLIVFKTNAQSMTAVMGKHVDSVGSSVSAAFKNVEAGRLRILAVSSPKRLKGQLANVPTMAESGLDVRGVSNCRYVYAPKGITPAQRAFWEKAMAAVNDDAEWKADIERRNQEEDFLIGKELEASLAETYEATKAAMTDIGLAKAK